MYEGGSKSNASYFITLAHNIRGGWCWCDGRRDWTFPLISHSMLLLCDRWQWRSSLTQWILTPKMPTKQRSATEFFHAEKMAPTDIHGCSLNIYPPETHQGRWAQWGSVWCISVVAAATTGYLCWYRFLWAQCAGSWSSLMNAYLMVVTMLKNSVL